ncbi:hypothetical protein K431DRAFT_311582 [Polychaeton citri CBS 116435]|uniref:Lysine-specific metallo-endopeptidase domain-containing protein n=1 Tax=Polychaeton citri CBS 116435 TaxID=1314669 RepID=A0A9P4UR97_9PEZI|nr:hypothetical protein K431DRAFT_311582 [Polychaeton citri CBS 116435]
MKTFLTLFSLGLAWLASCIHAYGIDNSCADQDLIQAAADSAVDMAAKALDAVEPPNGAARDQNVERLLDLLFRGPVTLSLVDDGRLLRRIAGVFRGVAKFAGKTNMVQPASAPTIADGVNIYCNVDRVLKRKNGDYADTSTGYILEDFDDSALNSCKTLSGDIAITWTPDATEDGNLYYPSQVTLCPWFYQWGRSQSLQQWSDLRTKSLLATAVIPAVTKGWPFTPIDAINLLDKVLLHEFTHTHACGGLRDVVMAKGGAPFFGVAYGWNAATTLARQDNAGLDNTPARNSDSYALFASGVRLLSKQPPVYIADDGKTVSTRPTKRDVPPEIQYPQTPAAFEGFITHLRAQRAVATAVEGT